MPINSGKLNPVSKPSWLKDTPSTTSSSASPSPTTRSWQRKPSIDTKKEDSPAVAEPTVTTKALKKEPEAPKKEVSAKLQSREIKVPLKVEKTIPPPSILKKTDQKPVETKKEPEVKNIVVEKKPPAKFGNKSPSSTPSKSLSTTPSKSPTPSKTPPSKGSTPSSKASTPSTKSPSKTPETYSDSDGDEDSEEEEDSDEEEETETESEEEEIDSDDDFDFSDNEPYRPPSPVNSKQKLIIPALKKVKKAPEPEPEKRSKSPEFTFKKPELKKVVTKEKSEVRERSQSPEPKFIKPKLRKVPSSLRTKNLPSREKLPVVELKKAPSKLMDIEPKKSTTEAFPLKPSVLRAESNKKIPAPPPPPPPPPPPGLKPPPNFEKKPLTHKHREIIEKLKSRPRRRPDWSEMMKEVEDGRKLRHVQCNDRSSPIITCKSMTKVQGQYVFETEKKNTALDKLLHEIQSGIKLRPTKTNDRSRPVLDGLRKFRRQMTIEEQIQKSESKAVLNTENPQSPLPDEEDELDDIDRVRDDLQSTKQMLALELRNKEAQERENKRLMAKIALLEAELQQSRGGAAVETNLPSCCAPVSNGTSDDVLVKSLKKEADEVQKTCKLLEKKYHDAAEQLDNAQKEIEEQKRYIANLEKKLNGGELESRRQSEAQQKESSPEMELVLSEEEENETEEQKAERLARRLKREVDMLKTKLTRLKEKEMNARNERKSLRDAMKKNQQMLKDEKKNFKKLQKEVEKMAAMMKAVEDECSDEEAEEPEEPEEEEEEESEPESEESESESESETESQSEDENAEDQTKKDNLEPRVKRHDGRLSSLKKGNYLLEANVERLKDEIKDHKEKCAALQADLDSVIDLC